MQLYSRQPAIKQAASLAPSCNSPASALLPSSRSDGAWSLPTYFFHILVTWRPQTPSTAPLTPPPPTTTITLPQILDLLVYIPIARRFQPPSTAGGGVPGACSTSRNASQCDAALGGGNAADIKAGALGVEQGADAADSEAISQAVLGAGEGSVAVVSFTARGAASRRRA